MIKLIVRNLLTLASNNFRIITHIKILLLKKIKKVCFFDDKPYTHNFERPASIYANEEISKSGKSVSIAVFDDQTGDLITLGKRGNKYMDQVKESGNIGTGVAFVSKTRKKYVALTDEIVLFLRNCHRGLRFSGFYARTQIVSTHL